MNMKKIFITLIVLATLVPSSLLSNDALAITQNQLNSTVQILCPDSYGNWYSGSGTIIDPKGIILTNKHVVTDEYGEIIKACAIGFIQSINQEPIFKTDGEVNAAEVKYYTTSEDMDAAILYISNKQKKVYPYVNIWSSSANALKFGDKIEAIGFPSIGGATITYTSGDFSGFGSKINGTQNYIKTTVSLEHGNSGGSSYSPNGQFLGIPTMVVVGSLSSMSYILSIDSIKNWLSGIMGQYYNNELPKQEPKIEKQISNIQNDVTPPFLEEFGLGYYGYQENQEKEVAWRYWDVNSKTSQIEPWGRVKFFWYEGCNFKECINDNSGVIKGYYYYFGQNPNADPKIYGKFISSNELVKKPEDASYYSYLNGSTKVVLPEIIQIKNEGRYYFILQAVDINNNVSNQLINFEYVYEKEDFKDIKGLEIFDINKKKIADISYNNFDFWNKFYSKYEIYTNQKVLYIKPDYGYSTNGVYYLVKKWDEACGLDRCSGAIYGKDGLAKWSYGDGDMFYLKPFSQNKTDYFSNNHQLLKIKFVSSLTQKITSGDNSELKINYNNTPNGSYNDVASRLKGRLLLQVEDKGRIWYVDFEGKRYEITFANAMPLFQKLSLGISNSDLDKIPTNDDNWHSTIGDRLKGRLLLQVEDKGRIWYVDFAGKRWEATWSNLMDLFESLSLGITNNDLNKIVGGSL
ncbi:serine protease [Candidatus Kuenenbacteria bacterium]|nr:serine protease [Candidatus Kuenenbacteria bacterium]